MIGVGFQAGKCLGKSHAKLMQALFPEDMGKVRKGDLGIPKTARADAATAAQG